METSSASSSLCVIRIIEVCSLPCIEDFLPHTFGFHGKFYDMTEIPGRPGEYEDRAVDYVTPIEALRRGGFDGYINSENEGQRHFQDMDFEHYSDDVRQVRRHHEMLKRLIGE
jgi:hypothetical protein